MSAGVFYTSDVGFNPSSFDGALGGNVGPFLSWDADFNNLVVDGQQFLGDPNVPHTFTGSPFGTNFVTVEGPHVGGWDALGNPIDIVTVNVGALQGMVWMPPIPIATTVSSAFFAFNKETTTIDVHATSEMGQVGGQVQACWLAGWWHPSCWGQGVPRHGLTCSCLSWLPVCGVRHALPGHCIANFFFLLHDRTPCGLQQAYCQALQACIGPPSWLFH